MAGIYRENVYDAMMVNDEDQGLSVGIFFIAFRNGGRHWRDGGHFSMLAYSTAAARRL
jgi:hypothetical protein